MKKLAFLLLFNFLCSNAQDKNAEAAKLGLDELNKIQETPFYISEKQGSVGLVDENFQPVLPPEFYYYEFYADNKFIKFTSTAGYTLYDLANKKILQEKKQWISEFHAVKVAGKSENFYSLRNFGSEDNLLYNEKNELIANLKEYSISQHGGENYGVLVLVNSTSDHFKMIDEKGNEIYASPYLFQPYAKKDYFLAKSKEANTYGIINHLGKKIQPFEFDNLYFKEEKIVMVKGTLCTITDLNFQPQFKIPSVQEIDFIPGEYLLIKIANDQWKLINHEGKTNFQVTAKKIEYFKKDIFRVINASGVYYIDMNGKKVH